MTGPEVVGMDGKTLNLSVPEPPGYEKAIIAIQRWRKILSLRVLVLLGLLGTIAMWAYAAMDPAILRLASAAGYSVIGFIPTLILYMKRSE